jgi:hypothetical protein
MRLSLVRCAAGLFDIEFRTDILDDRRKRVTVVNRERTNSDCEDRQC